MIDWPAVWGAPRYAPVRALLAPLEVGFRLAVAARNRSYDLGLRSVRQASIPVISVGNLTVGGTGKTPVTAWLARSLADRGLSPAVVSRGYGDDEIALHRRWNPDVPIIVARARYEGVEDAARTGARVALLDDGFQHRCLHRDLDIVLLAAEQSASAPLLPRGPAREPLGALRRAQVAVVTRKTATDAQVAHVAGTIGQLEAPPRVARVDLVPTGWSALSGHPSPPPTADALLVVASVADPAGVVDTVERSTGLTAELLAFPDHHAYQERDLAMIRDRARGRAVVTTEKDAVKLELHARALPRVFVLVLGIRPVAGVGELLASVDAVVPTEVRPPDRAHS